MYIDLLQCRVHDLHVKTLQGNVSDSGRAAHAEILLLDAAHNEAAHVSTGPSGNFSFSGALVGAFELRIEGEGFNPVHMPLTIEPTAGSSSLEIEAGYGLGCSTVRAK